MKKYIITATCKNWVLAVSFLLSSSISFAKDSLVILSPHRKSLQDEFVPRFKDYYQKKFGTAVDVEWLDQGGTSNDVRFLKAKLAANPKTAGVDVFWGGPSLHFIEMAHDGLLASYPLTGDLAKQVPSFCSGIPLRDKDSMWHASAISSFGILFNRPAMKSMGTREPKTWEDLTSPTLFDTIALADPRNSGTNATINTIILQSLGWDRGWETITAIASNTRKFYSSSSEPLKAVESGEALASMVIDFYGLARQAELGPDKIGFLLPADKTILDSDPIALVKGAPNAAVAKRFIDYILSPEAQVVLMLPKGSKDGPTVATHARMAMNPAAYALAGGKEIVPLNPFKGGSFFKYDASKAAETSRVINDLIGTTLIDMHSDLKKAWASLLKAKSSPQTLQAFLAPIVSETEVAKMAPKWSDSVYRNQVVNQWVETAKKKYAVATAH